MYRRSLMLAAALAVSAVAAAPATALPAKSVKTATAKRDLAQEERNRTLVLAFSDAAFSRHDFAAAASMLAPDYLQHNPRVPTGRDAFIAFYARVVAANPGLNSTTLRSATDGDLVYTHTKVTSNSGKTVAIVNIFRVANGKIVEHWDVVQEVPETASNTNTMF